MLFFTQREASELSSEGEKILPMGLWGVLRTIMRVLGVMAAERTSWSSVQSAEDVFSVEPLEGGVSGT